MNHHAPRAPARKQASLRVEGVPFADLPNQSKLFLDYLDDPLALRKYYPNAVVSWRAVRDRASVVLAEYKTDRRRLCDALSEFNSAIGAGPHAAKNIELLRRPDTIAVVSGQQAGLFTGPLYTVYKALSAIRMAEELSALGAQAVPVFWVASEDHDLNEVSETFFLGASGAIVRTEYRPKEYVEGSPVGDVEIDASIAAAIDKACSGLAPGDASPAVRAALESAWTPGSSFSAAFAKDLAAVLHKFGLVFVDPLHGGLKELAAPIYTAAVENAGEIVSGMRKRSAELVDAGYHAQVLVEEDYFPLFWHTDDGRRVALRKMGDRRYRSKDEGREFTTAELTEIAANEPRRLSPGVLLRPVVQDYLLPTVCYFGGAAEIAYFAQNSEAYRILGRPVTPIFHRQSFTFVEAKQDRILDKLQLGFPDLLAGMDTVLKNALERTISPETGKLFADVEEKINTELNRLDQALSDLDPTLAANLATRRRKVIYHIGALRKKAYAAKLRKEGTIERQVNAMFNALLPNGELQERVINVHSYLIKYGPGFIDSLYDTVDLDDRRHRVVSI